MVRCKLRNEKEAEEKDKEIRNLLDRLNIHYITLPTNKGIITEFIKNTYKKYL